MFKKFMSLILILVIISVSGIVAFADPTDNSAPTGVDKEEPVTIDKDKDIPEYSLEDILNSAITDTDQFLVTIKKPSNEKDYTTYKKAYVISVVANEYEDIRIVLEKFDSDKDKYIPFYDANGENQWDIGSFGAFAKEIKLEKGVNKIRLKAYRTSKKDDLKLEDVQVKNFTLTLLDETLKDKIKNTIKSTIEAFNKLITNTK